MTRPARPCPVARARGLFLFGVYVLPTLGLFRTAFHEVSPAGAMIEGWSLKTARELLHDSFTLELTMNSLWLSLSATCIALTLRLSGFALPVSDTIALSWAPCSHCHLCRCLSPAWYAFSDGLPSSAIKD